MLAIGCLAAAILCACTGPEPVPGSGLDGRRSPPATGPVLPDAQEPGGARPRGGVPFTSASPFRLPIPADPVLDPDSAAIVRRITAGTNRGSLYDYAFPIYEAAPGDPRYHVSVSERWGPNPFAAFNPVPIPDGAAPAPGTDHAMVVIDPARRLSYEFWGARKTRGRWRARWGGVYAIDAPQVKALAGFSTGSGISRLAGTVRVEEVAAGEIPHALVFAATWVRADVFRYPATKTDGRLADADAIAQGSRIQLDPAVDVDAIVGITPLERAVAKALQVYGAYCNDTNSSAGISFIFEGDDPVDTTARPPGEPGNPAHPPDGAYYLAGAPPDAGWMAFPHIPWDRLRVLRRWDGR